MNSFLYKMERKYGKYAIRNLPLCLVIGYAFGYLMQMIKPEYLYVLSLNPYAILHGQVWRLFTWILIPEPQSIFFTLIALYFYYSIGRTLEKTWGSFLFNVYFFSGFVFTIIGSFLVFGYFQIFGQEWLSMVQEVFEAQQGLCPGIYGGSYGYMVIANSFSTYYINMSIFLAFAIMYPEMKVYLFFVLPIKVKVLGIIYTIILLYEIVSGFLSGISSGIIMLCAIGMSLLNTLLFFVMTKKGRYKSPKEIKRQREFKVKIKNASRVTRHKCAICGQTDEDNPDMVFRYCTKCEGNYEYCSEHLFTHEHVRKQ